MSEWQKKLHLNGDKRTRVCTMLVAQGHGHGHGFEEGIGRGSRTAAKDQMKHSNGTQVG